MSLVFESKKEFKERLELLGKNNGKNDGMFGGMGMIITTLKLEKRDTK